ncbi:conserved hypothetical protein [Gammaproteobacteria bacterium]
MPNHYHEDDYHAAYRNINPTPCVFEKAILAHCVACELTEKHLLAERETINCRDAVAQQTCSELRKALRNHFAFSLRVIKSDDPLPHGKESKIQCGGLQGLQQVLSKTKEVTNVHQLILDALAKYYDLESLPYSEIVPTVAHFNLRRHH